MVDLHVVALFLQQVAGTTAQTVTQAAELTKDTNSISTTVIVSAAASYVIKWLKNSAWFPLLSKESSLWYQRGFAIVVAVFTSLGIHYTYDATVGSLVVTGLLGASLYDHFVDFLKSFIMQQLVYDGAVKSSPANPDKAPAV